MIRLRPLEQSDFDWLQSFFENPEVAEYARRHPPLFTWFSRSTFLQVLAHTYLVEADGAAVGTVTLTNVDGQAKKAEIGAALLPSARNKKVAKEALFQLGDWAFNCLQLNKLYALVLPESGLGKILAGHGFTLEGRLRDNVYFQGAYRDEEILSLTRAEFEALSMQTTNQGDRRG